MLRKQRKLQLWRRFGYVIFIIIKSGELLLWFSPRIINGLRSYIKHSKGCFIRYPNTLKLVKKNLAAPRFLNHFSVFGYRMKHSSSCLIYYVTSIFNYCTICKTFIQYQDNIKQTIDENKSTYKVRNHYLIQYQILQTNFIRIVWQTVRIISKT